MFQNKKLKIKYKKQEDNDQNKNLVWNFWSFIFDL